MQDWSLEFGNGSYPYFLLIGIALIVMVGAYYRKTAPELPSSLKLFLFVFRTLSIILIVLFLCLPTLVVTNERVTGQKLAVLIDNSGSMGFSDDGVSRSRQLQSIFNEFESGVSAGNLIAFSFSDSITRLPSMAVPPPDSNLTALGDAIREIATLQNSFDIGGMLVVSDGISNYGSDPSYEAMRAGIPISAIALGDTIPMPDISIEDVKAPEVVYRGEQIDFDLTLKSDMQNDIQAELETYSGKKRLRSQTVLLPRGGAAKDVRISIPADSIGRFNYRFDLRSNFPEHLTNNNSKAASVQILKDKLKIFLIGETPNWEFSFMKRILSSNNKYSISSYLPGKGSKKILLPADEGFNEYDCIFLVGCGNETYSRYGSVISNLIGAGKLNVMMGLSTASAKSGFGAILKGIGLSSGGNDLVSVKGEFSPQVHNKTIPDPLLRPLLDNSASDFSNLPPILFRFVGLHPESDWEVVMNSRAGDGTEEPLLLKRAMNGNRVVILNGGPIWRWDFYMNRADKPDSRYKFIIENIVTWLTVGGQIRPIEVSTDKPIYNSGDRVRFKGRILDDNYRPINEAGVVVKLAGKYGNEIVFELQNTKDGNYEGGPGRLFSGEYIYQAYVTVSGDTIKTLGSFDVDEFSEEYRSLTANRKLLREITSNTGGVYFDVEKNPRGPFPLRKGSIVEKAALNIYSLPAALAIVLILLAIEWAVRKKRQLP